MKAHKKTQIQIFIISVLEASLYNTLLYLLQLKKIFESRTGSWGIADGIVQQAIRRAEANVAWADDAFPSMEAWLEKYLVNHKKE